MASSLDDFLNQLRSLEEEDELTEFCRKHVLHGTPFVFREREEDYYEFRKRIADKFSITYNEVLVTGSAKLGFSPLKQTEFGYESDVDVAITSEDLFDQFMESVREYQMNLRDARRTVSSRELGMYHEFLEYVALGWIRPDKLPLSFRVHELKSDWFEFFDSISNGNSEVGNYKVAAGVFKTALHLELYSVSGIRKVRESISLTDEQNEQAN